MKAVLYINCIPVITSFFLQTALLPSTFMDNVGLALCGYLVILTSSDSDRFEKEKQNLETSHSF